MGCGASAPSSSAGGDLAPGKQMDDEPAPPARAATAKKQLEAILSGKTLTGAPLSASHRPSADSMPNTHHRFDVAVPAPSDASKIDPTPQQAYATESTAVLDHHRVAHEVPEQADVFKYGPIVAPHEDAIRDLFQTLDKDGNGFLIKSELKHVVALYNGGGSFDEAQFFSWYDVHGRDLQKGPDGQVDLHEFGWYLADVALSFGSDLQARNAMGSIITTFERLAKHETAKQAAGTPAPADVTEMAAAYNRDSMPAHASVAIDFDAEGRPSTTTVDSTRSIDD